MRWGGGGGVRYGHDGQNGSVLARLGQFTSSWVSCRRFRYCRKGQEGSGRVRKGQEGSGRGRKGQKGSGWVRMG
jgi:hypothetical protein